uniref:Desmoplakin a n=1 Tax=Denticeps clupeoides TaxID=299321 RepID=A0AAY4E3A3_9TELE
MSLVFLRFSKKMSYARASHLKELQNIIEEISKAIMWVNEHEEEELVFDWGDKNIDVYIPKKQESYSKLMRDLEEKEKELNKLKQKVDVLLTSHPASDKIEAYMETLQTQWSWLLQITKCIHVHLKENAAYSQFFKEANETYAKLQKDHESIRKKFSCDKNTPLESLTDLEKEKLMENKRQVQTLVNKSKNIVRLKPRSPDEKSSGQVIVQALCDFKQDQKGIMKGNEAILKDNSQRSKWQVTGPGGLDMMIPSVCLIIPPPNPLSITLANKNEQYYEAIMGIWNQLYINIKSLMSWQYCMRDINQINSLTLTMLSKMRPEEYRSIVKSLETHYQEFLRSSHGSEMFGDEDKRKMESQYVGAQTHYDQLVVQLPAYSKHCSLAFLIALRRRLEGVELGLGQHLHVPLRDDAPQECSHRTQSTKGHWIHLQWQEIHSDLDSIRNEYLRLREKILQQLDGAKDPEQVRFLRGELEFIDQKLGNLQNFSAVYLKRLTALKALLESLYQAEDIVKVHEARLVEKETTSLDVNDIAKYRNNLKQMKSELEQKKDLLKTMESELVKAVEWNGRIDQSFHQCDVDLSKYGEIVGQMTDRWRPVLPSYRMGDLEKQERQLKQYQQSSGETSRWIDHTQQRQDELQAAKCKDVQSLKTHIDRQKILFSEIKGKKEDVENVHKDADTCASLIKDYELGLASYSAGLETLLNIPIKRTLLHSPATDITEEATSIQARYIELLTRSSDYYKFLAEMLKNMEELKIRNTKIEILEEELERLKNVLNDKSQKNQTLLDSMSKQEVELTQTKELLVNMEVVKRDHARQCSELKDNLSQNYNSLQNLKDEVTRLTYQIDDEKRKRMLAEERYSNQQKDYEEAVRKRQKELDDLKWAKVDVEKALKDKQHEVERLRMQLQEEAARRQAAESETSKVRSQCNQEISSLKQTFESQIHVTKTTVLMATQQKEEDVAALRMECDKVSADKRALEEELRRVQNSFSQVEEARRKAEDEVHQQRSTGTEESRRRRELEVQIQTFVRQRTNDELKHKEALTDANRTMQERNRQITQLTQKLEEETRWRKALEAESQTLRQSQMALQSEKASSQETINKMKISEQELRLVRIELEKRSDEKIKVEQSISRLQARIGDLQELVDKVEMELELEKKNKQDEFTRRKRVEAELERMNQTCREYTTTITTLKVQQDQESVSVRRNEQDLRALKEALDKSIKECKATVDKLNTLMADLRSVQSQLVQEQARLREVNLRNEALQKAIEEKSRALNENVAEIDKLQSLTQKLTKDRLKLEEELRSVRQERDDLRSSKDSTDSETTGQIATLQIQLQKSNKLSLEHQALISELTREREGLKSEITKIQKQAMENTMMIHESQTSYNEVRQERDNLLTRIKLLDQEKNKQLKLEDELSRVKVSLESELRFKQRLQEDLGKMTNDFNYWKSQCALKEGQARQFESEKSKADRERSSLQNELDKMKNELRTLEQRYKSQLQSSERQVSELSQKRESLETDIKRLQLLAMVDPSKLLFDGVHRKVSAQQLYDCGIIDKGTLEKLLSGQKTVSEVAVDIQPYLYGSTCIAGIYDEANDRIMPIYKAMKEGLLRPGTTLELLEAQAASGFMIDPVNNVSLTVEEAWKRGLVGKEFKGKLLSAERAVTGYKDPHTGKVISLFQAIEKELIERGHGIRLLEAQIASGGIIDPIESHRIDVEVAYKRGYFDREMNEILTYEGDDTKGFFDPNTHENLTYLQLKEKCITDSKTGLILLPLHDKKKSTQQQQSSQKNTLRKRRVVIVDPDTGKEMSVREAYHRELIDYETFLELSEQECEWEEICIKATDGSTRLSIVDRKTGTQYDVQEALDKGIITQTSLDQYRSGSLTLTQFADLITSKSRSGEMSIYSSNSPVGAIFDTETLEKITIPEAQRRGIVDNITAQRLLEAQACTGGIINPASGERLALQDAVHQAIIDEDMAAKLKPAHKAYTGFEDVKTKRKLSTAEAIKEKWLPYEAGQRFLEFQYLTGGLVDPGTGKRIGIEEAIRRGWVDGRGAQKLQETKNYLKILTCPKTKLKISYKDAMDNCMVEDMGLKMLQATSMSTKGISSPYNVSSGPGSRSGSRTGSRSGSRRGSVDYSSISYSYTSSTSKTFSSGSNS